METRDADGYVFRTDLRLRPDPAATPPAIAIPGHHLLREHGAELGTRGDDQGAAGGRRSGAGHGASWTAIRPFVWRRGLDFAAVADIHAMKRRIDEAYRRRADRRTADPVARIAGHNVKLGEGGIREIEFLVQTLQLVWGGRDPTVRDRPTCGALHGW